MKKTYDIKLRHYLWDDKIIILVFIVAIIAGTLYGILDGKNNENIFLLLGSYYEPGKESQLLGTTFIKLVCHYLKPLIIIWLLGFFSFTVPIGLLIFLSSVFSYAFTTTCLILGYGVQGALVAFCTYGIQAILIVGIGMYLSISALRKNNDLLTKKYNSYGASILIVVLGVCLTAGLDLFIMSKFKLIMNIVL